MGPWLAALRRRQTTSATAAASGRLPQLIMRASAGLLLALWVGVVWLLASSREAAIGYALKNDTHLAVAVAEQTARVFDSVNEALERLATAAQDGTLRPTDYARFASETGLGHEILTQVSLVGADGRFIGSDLDPTGMASGVVDLSDRPHVRAHLAAGAGAAGGAGAAMFVGLPTLGKVSQVWTVQLSKRVGPRERPAGVVVASLRVAYFEAMFGRLQAERGDVLGLVGADGVVRAGSPGHAAVVAGRPWPGAEHLGLADGTVWSMGSLQLPAAAGGPLLYSRQKVFRYPLHVVVASAEATALKAWRQSATVVAAMAALITGIVCVAALAVLRSVRRLHEKNLALAASEARATELSESRGRWLAERTAELAATQHQLVQQEKLAALGQLVASVAHEINTPIAAIAATGRNIGEALGQALDDVPRLRLQLDDGRWALFLQLLRARQQAVTTPSTREERAATRALATRLQAWGLADATACAGQLVRLGVTPDTLVSLQPLLVADDASPSRDALLAAALNLGTIDEGTRLINTAVQRVSKIVYSLKSLSHPGAQGALQVARLAEGLEHALTLYAHHFRHGVVLVRQIADCPALHCSPDELSQVWLNLIHNALHAMQGEGTLTVSLHAEADGAAAGGRAWQVVRIADTGCGIAPEIQARVFDAFFTTKPAGEGSGLGLDISRRIVERHGGSIRFDSRPGQGTCFEVRLPAEGVTPALGPATQGATHDLPEPSLHEP